MNFNPVLANTLALDAQGLAQLKQQAKDDPNKAIGPVAKQFEVLFLNMMLKSMREATPQDGPFDSDQSRLYTSMLDQQLAQHMSSRGIGLAEVLERQLSRSALGSLSHEQAAAEEMSPSAMMSAKPANPLDLAARVRSQYGIGGVAPQAAPAAGTALSNGLAANAAGSTPFSKTRDFVNRIWKHATDAARATGIKAQFMVGQAALESGWGKSELRLPDGTSSHNLFSIKAGGSWKGPVVEKLTTEYVNGVAQKQLEKFRVYGSYEESFRDYARLMRDNPRYANVIDNAQDAKGFARGLQKAGYATDPAYAQKLLSIINGTTLRAGASDNAASKVLA